MPGTQNDNRGERGISLRKHVNTLRWLLERGEEMPVHALMLLSLLVFGYSMRMSRGSKQQKDRQLISRYYRYSKLTYIPY